MVHAYWARQALPLSALCSRSRVNPGFSSVKWADITRWGRWERKRSLGRVSPRSAQPGSGPTGVCGAVSAQASLEATSRKARTELLCPAVELFAGGERRCGRCGCPCPIHREVPAAGTRAWGAPCSGVCAQHSKQNSGSAQFDWSVSGFSVLSFFCTTFSVQVWLMTLPYH